MKTKEEKLNIQYAVKSSGGIDLQVKDVDLNKRIVQFIANTYYYLDSDYDIIIKGAANKSIAERGPNSQAVAKIKHLRDHKMSVNEMVGKIVEAEEKTINGLYSLTVSTKIPKTTKGDDDLIQYQEEIYDNHSIGFVYEKLALAVRDDEDEDRRNRFNEFYPQIINPEKADESGFFWIIKEFNWFEVSTVTFGSNSLTPYLGSKTRNPDSLLLELNKRQDLLLSHMRNGQSSDETMKLIELESRQIKQIMSDVVKNKPSIKDTLKEPLIKDAIDYAKLTEGINIKI